MRKKIFRQNLLLGAAAVLLTALIAAAFVYARGGRLLERSLSSDAALLKAGLENTDTAYLDRVALRGDHRVTLISADGDVLFDSEVASSAQESHANRQEVKEAAEDGVGEETRFSETMERRTFYYAIKLENGSILRVSAPAASFPETALSLWWLLPAGFLPMLLAAWLLSGYTAKKLAAPLNNLRMEELENAVLFEELSPLLADLQKEKKAVRKKLKKFRRKQVEFTAITDYMREGFLVLDKQANILSHNKSALILLDFDFPDATNRSILELNRSQALTNAVRDALDGKPQEFILPVGERRCQIFANPVWYKNRSQGAVIVILDVTEKQEREKFRREFTANVSHELRTPLTSISGYAEIIANGVAKPEDIPKFAGSIYKEAQRMIALIADILLLSKMDENHASLTKEQTDLRALCRDVITRLQDKADARDITVHFEGEEAFLNGIPSVLDEVVFNVVDNAVKYNREHGRIDITLRNLGSSVKLTVADTGTGIPLAEQERVFERFYRVDKSRENSAQSTGLGLSIVKHGAALHNAKLELQSDGKTGTVITILFPV